MSGENEKDTAASRSKDGVPSWNGEASTFVAYEKAACLWEQGLVYNKRYTAAPRLMAELTGPTKRLMAELTGPTKRLVARKPVEEVDFPATDFRQATSERGDRLAWKIFQGHETEVRGDDERIHHP